MAKRERLQTSKGFTLIELLVVIAIIGILSALLFPGIQSALLRARAAARGGEMRSAFVSIFDKTLFGEDSWPTDDAAIGTVYTTSTDYFEHLLTNGTIKGVDFRLFSAPGLREARTRSDWTDFGEDANAWCVTLGLTEDAPDSVPFLFTRNIQFDGTTVDTLNEAEPLNPDEQPFGDKVAVVIYKGGHSVVYTKDTLTREAFNPPDPITDEARDFEFITPGL